MITFRQKKLVPNPTLYKVHNLREGGRPAPQGYSSWMDYWEKALGIENYNLIKCHVKDCNELATDGAHVQLDDPDNDNWYIVPMCHAHNCQFGEHLEVWGPLVPVNPMTPILY